MTANPKVCQRCGQPHGACAGHNRRGGPCGRAPMKGQRVCMMHGGKSPGAEQKAQQRIVQAEAEKVLARIWNPNAVPVTDSVSEMQRLAGSLRQAVDALGLLLEPGEVCEVCGRGRVDLEAVGAAAWLRSVRELRTLLADMERLGIAQRGMELAEAYGQQIEAVVRRVLERLELDERQLVLVPVVVPEELRRVAVLEAGEGAAS